MEDDYARLANEFQTVWTNTALLNLLEVDGQISLDRIDALLLAVDRCLSYLDAIEGPTATSIPYFPVYPQNSFSTGLPS